MTSLVSCPSDCVSRQTGIPGGTTKQSEGVSESEHSFFIFSAGAVYSGF